MGDHDAAVNAAAGEEDLAYQHPVKTGYFLAYQPTLFVGWVLPRQLVGTGGFIPKNLIEAGAFLGQIEELHRLGGELYLHILMAFVAHQQLLLRG